MDLRNLKDEEVVDQLALRVSNGSSIRQLAKDWEMPFTTLRDLLNRHKAPAKPPKPTPEKYRNAVSDVFGGMPIRRAANLNNVSKSMVHYYVTKEKKRLS